jgi:hypothetical protein
MDTYGIWCFGDRKFDDVGMSRSNALGLVLYCVEEDEIGVKNYAVIRHDENLEPIWHDMIWCGQFQGYDWLYKECLRLGEVIEAIAEDGTTLFL